MSRTTWTTLTIGAAATSALAAATFPAAGAAAVVVTLLVGLALVTRTLNAVPPRENGVAGPTAAAAHHEQRAILDVLTEGVIVVGSDEVVLLANRAAADLLGRERDSMEGVSMIRAVRIHDLVHLVRNAVPGPPVEREVTLDDLLLLVRVTVIDGGRTVMTLLDRTAQRRAERARQDLIANISHELRTPIAAARALAETLADGVPDPVQRERFHVRLVDEIDRLGTLVQRLLRLARIEHRESAFVAQPERVGDLLRDVVVHMLPVAERAGVDLINESGTASAFVLADRELIVEVLTNLIDNAIRFSPGGGGVRIGAAIEGERARFWVQDDGPGILPSERHRVFERFYTTDRARTGGDGGTGLGLAIAKNIVTRHGGEIWVADRTPGATICFTLPVAEPPVEESLGEASRSDR